LTKVAAIQLTSVKEGIVPFSFHLKVITNLMNFSFEHPLYARCEGIEDSRDHCDESKKAEIEHNTFIVRTYFRSGLQNENIINQPKYITFLVHNTKISDNNAESGKVPRMLAAFPRWIAREILSKRNFFDFESPDSAISRSPMTLMKLMASLHQGPKVS
jgi:hypothetical protein